MASEASETYNEYSTPKSALYSEILKSIQKDPMADIVWAKTLELAKAEEANGNGQDNFYSHVPLDELIEVGQKLRSTSEKAKQYDILSGRSSNGQIWYDVILGHVNDKMFAPVENHLSHLYQQRGIKWENGLDVGSGTGNTLRAIAPYFERVFGVDKLKAVLQKAKDEDTLPENVEVVAGSATDLMFDKQTFDVAVSNGLTYYLEKDEMHRFVKEIARVLKPGGLYLESRILKDEDALLPGIEKEYLTSAKALLVCLIDNIITHHPTATKLGFSEVLELFASEGFEYAMSDVNDEGVWFLEFKKAS